MSLIERLREAEADVPTLIAYNRLDPSGSSLDLREFQLAFASDNPRTIGITIDKGTVIRAYPLEESMLGVMSDDFGFDHEVKLEDIHTRDESKLKGSERGYWLLVLMKHFGLPAWADLLQSQQESLS